MKKIAIAVLAAAAAAAAAACQTADAPTAPRTAARSASRDAGAEALATYLPIDVSQGPGSGYLVDDADDVIEDVPIAGGGTGERLWTEAQGLMSIVAPDGIPLETDAIDARGDLAGYTYDGVTMRPWYRPAGGSLRQIDLPSNEWFYLQAINDSGEVAGGYVTATNTTIGFVWSPTRGLVGTMPESAPGDFVIASAVNNLDEVVGWIQRGNTGQNDAFTWSPATGMSVSNYGATKAIFTGVNDAGMRVLHIGDAPAHAALVDASGEVTPLPNPFGGEHTAASRINNDGYVAGGATDPARGNIMVPLIWAPDLSASALPTLTPGAGGSAYGLNAAGDAAGTARGSDGANHAVLWKHTPTTAELEQLVDRYVSKAGVANALNAKLQAGAVGAFINQVRAQSGKALTSVHADVLVRLAQRL